MPAAKLVRHGFNLEGPALVFGFFSVLALCTEGIHQLVEKRFRIGKTFKQRRLAKPGLA
jgi:hypothetical protein